MDTLLQIVALVLGIGGPLAGWILLTAQRVSRVEARLENSDAARVECKEQVGRVEGRVETIEERLITSLQRLHDRVDRILERLGPA